MAERKAVNKYYPPEWRPEKGSLNKFRGTHALRERARKLHMGILIIRFEMPFNIWCEGCGNHIGMGVRYNAEKTKVGMYYTTPVYKFKMKCHLCTNHFEIQTDPKNLDYIILNGARRQERRWEPSENDQVAPEDKDISKKLATDPMYRLEHGADDKAKQKALAPTLSRLEVFQDRWKDDYELNKILRNKFRAKKKSLKAAEEKDRALLTKSSLTIPLQPESSDDVKLAGLMRLAPAQSQEEWQKAKREEIISRPLFPGTRNVKDKSSESPSFHPLKAASLDKEELARDLGIVKKYTKVPSQPSEDSSSRTTVEPSSNTDIHANNAKNDRGATNQTKPNHANKNRSSLVAFDYDSTSEENSN